MTDITTIVDKYCAAWCEPDEANRLEYLRQSFAEDGIYQDPTAAVVGIQALSDHIGAIHASSPGAQVRPTSGIDSHNEKIRFTWHFVDSAGVEQIRGTDFGELSSDGRLTKIVGFFDPAPEL